MISLGILAVIVVVFLISSLRFSDSITYTDEETLTTPSVTVADPQRGNTEAKVRIVVFSDYACPSCATLDTTLQALSEKYPDDLLVVWKDMPNDTRYPQAIPAAIAARCAGEQKQFWAYHDLLLQNQAQLGDELYSGIATSLKLNEQTFNRCRETESTKPLVERTFNEGIALGITATPTVWINDERYTGLTSTSELERAFKTALNKK